MLKETAAEGVMQHKMKSRERGAAWLNVANRLAPTFPNVEVTSRAIRHHFKVMEKKHKFYMTEEERATGIAGEELTEAEGLLEELIEISEETEKRTEEDNETRSASIEKEKVQAIEMRISAMERIGETRKRHEKENENPEKKRRRSGEATFEWLREKTAMEKNLSEEELKDRREERESRQEEIILFAQQMQMMQESNNAQLQQFIQQQQQQKHQHQQQFAMLQQQMLAMMQQQQQQTQVLAKTVTIKIIL